MYISKVTIKQGPALFKLLKQNGRHDGYTAHQLLWKLFPNNGDKKRDFLFCKIDKVNLPQYLLVSRNEPSVIDGISVETKPYAPVLSKHQRFAFSLTVNPIVSRKVEGKIHSEKHDIWMDAKIRSRKEGSDKKTILKACETASKQWLIEQGNRRGFLVNEDDIVVNGYIQNRIYKMRQGKPIQYSSIHYEGILSVTDVDLFTGTLFEGIGRSKAFGCGLMLIRKIY